MEKISFEALLAIHTSLRETCKTREEWRQRWDQAITDSGWQKLEFYDAIDEYCYQQVTKPAKETEDGFPQKS